MQGRSRWALVGAVATGGLLAATWFAAFHVATVQRVDQSILKGFLIVGRHRKVSGAANVVADLCNPNPYIYLAAVPIIVAVVRRRLALAIAIAAILLGANVTSQLLKPLLAHARPASLLGGHSPVSAASWPSGHATAAMALALCLVLAAPARFRPLAAAVGASFAVAVSYSFLSLGWHYPSDVLGGYLVAIMWTLLVLAALFRLPSSSTTARSTAGVPPFAQALGPSALALAAALAMSGAVLVARPAQVVAYARVHETFIIGAAAIAVLAFALATGVMLALRR